MWKMPVMPHHGTCLHGRRAEALDMIERPLPLFYMADYSELGIFVDQHDAALEALEADRFDVTPESEVILESPEAMQRVLEVLEKAGIDFEVADTVGGIYQG